MAKRFRWGETPIEGEALSGKLIPGLDPCQLQTAAPQPADDGCPKARTFFCDVEDVGLALPISGGG